MKNYRGALLLSLNCLMLPLILFFSFDSWRVVADPICDDALSEALDHDFTKSGRDLLGSVRRCAREYPDATHCPAFLSAASITPPRDLIATPEDLKLGHEFYFQHFLQINIGILYFAIVGGFSR